MLSVDRRWIERGGRATARDAFALAVGATAALAGAAFTTIPLVLAPADLSVDIILLSLAVLVVAAVGTVLAVRVPGNTVGWLLLAAGWLLGLEFLAIFYAEGSHRVADGAWPGTVLAVWLYGNLLIFPVAILTCAIPLVFPDGRLVSRRWRWLVVLLAFVIGENVLGWFRPGLIADTDIENPFAIAGLERLLDVLDVAPLSLAAVPIIVGPIAAVAIRFRRGGPLERAQLKWLIAAVAAALVAWSTVAVGEALGVDVVRAAGWYGALLAMTALPLAIGVAVLRYRLYEIDRIISRTIAWALVTGVLIAVFGLAVVGLEAALAGLTQGETLAVAASTLLAAALFQPLRQRVQRAVDRRFDRASYDASRTVEVFAERLRHEVALEAVVDDIEATATVSVRPASRGVWLRGARP